MEVTHLTISSTRISPHTRGTRNICKAWSKHRKLMVGGIYRLIPGRSITLPMGKVMEVLGHIKELNKMGLVEVLGPGRQPVDLEALPDIQFLRGVPASSQQREPFKDTISQDTFTGYVMPSSKHGSAPTGEVFEKASTKTLSEIDAGLAEPEPQPDQPEPAEALDTLAELDEAMDEDEESSEDAQEEASSPVSMLPLQKQRRRGRPPTKK